MSEQTKEQAVSLERKIKDVTDKLLTDGTVEKLVQENVTKGINKALEDLFGNYGPATKEIKAQLESVVVPHLKKHDYSEYLTTLDALMTEVLQATTADNRTLMENFKDFLTTQEIRTIKLSKIFGKFGEHVAAHVETDGLEVNTDDSPCYEAVEIQLEIKEEDRPSWSSMEYANAFLTCEHDETMNVELRLIKFSERMGYRISDRSITNVHSLRYTSKFELFLMSLAQFNTEIELDIKDCEDYVTPEKEPDVSFS